MFTRLAVALIATAVVLSSAAIATAADTRTVLEFQYDLPPDAGFTRHDEQAVALAVKKRLAAGQITGATVKARGGDRIGVTVPTADAKQVDRIAKLVQQPGTLEFRILASRVDHKTLIEKAENAEGSVVKNDGGEEIGRWVPIVAGEEAAFEKDQNLVTRKAKGPGQAALEVLVVDDPYDVGGKYLQSAQPTADRAGHPSIDFTLTERGGKLFGRLTSTHLPDEVTGRSFRLGIILGGQLRSAPSIRATITNRGQITGRFTAEEVRDIVAVLNAGALPVRLKLIDSRREE